MKRVAVGMLALLGAASSAWSDVARHSGQVISFDPAAGTLRIAELTASPGPEPIVVERVVHVASSTQVHVVRRTATLEHWPVTWDAEPLAASAVGAGDFVTVTADGETAVKLEVVRPGAETRG